MISDDGDEAGDAIRDSEPGHDVISAGALKPVLFRQ